MKQHIHTGQVEGGDFFFLTIDFANLAAMNSHLTVDVKQQRARTAGDVEHVAQFFFDTG